VKRLVSIAVCVSLLVACASSTRTGVRAAGSGDTVVIEVEWFGETVGRIDRLSDRTRRVRLDDPNLIAGLRKGLVGIRAGETRRVEVPWAKGYGDAGRPPVIPPREDLTVVVRCREVVRDGS
jgi:hypothetical protein